jgi:predicted RNase H-like HicB family nuclease
LPDFPGCVTFCSSFEEAKIKAREVLELWLDEQASQGESIKVPSYRPIVDDIKATMPVGAKVIYAPADR